MKHTYKILLIITIILIAGCTNNKDALKFKNDYESININKIYRKVKINKNNPIKYTTFNEVNNKIKNNDTFILFIGSKTCAWSRSTIETLINEANAYGIRTIYYIEIRPNGVDSDQRDLYDYKENTNKKIYLSHKGTDDYRKFLKLTKNVLDNYSYNNITLNNTKFVNTPSLFMIKKGKIKTKITGISNNQKTENQKINDNIKNDMIKIYDEFFEKYTKI